MRRDRRETTTRLSGVPHLLAAVSGQSHQSGQSPQSVWEELTALSRSGHRSPPRHSILAPKEQAAARPPQVAAPPRAAQSNTATIIK